MAYKPGDMPPPTYPDRYDWAEVQHEAGLLQRECTCCKKWVYPQEISPPSDRYDVVCLECDALRQGVY